MESRTRHRIALLATLVAASAAAVSLTACGGGGDDGGSTQNDAARAGTTPGGRSGSTTPGGGSGGSTTPGGGSGRSTTPGGRTGAADPDDVQVVVAWARTLRRGDVEGAAEFFALPSVVANGARPLELATRADALAFNRSLPCGAEVVDTKPADDGFFVVDFRLTDRPGGDCGSGVGETASTAFHVTDGKIDHWFRVPTLARPVPEGTPS